MKKSHYLLLNLGKLSLENARMDFLSPVLPVANKKLWAEWSYLDKVPAVV